MINHEKKINKQLAKEKKNNKNNGDKI